MLGIVIALPSEVEELLSKMFSDKFTHTINGKVFYILKTINEKSVILTFSGVGKANAAMTTALLINSFKVNKCLNIGSCAGVCDLKTFDVMIVNKTLYGDVDVTDFGYELNQVPKMPAHYLTDNKLNEVINSIVSISGNPYYLGNCYTCDSFIKKENIGKFNINTKCNVPTAIDMECSAIAQVCHTMNVKFCAIKVISDDIHNPEQSATQFNNNIQKVATIIDTLTYNIIQAIMYAEDK